MNVSQCLCIEVRAVAVVIGFAASREVVTEVVIYIDLTYSYVPAKYTAPGRSLYDECDKIRL